MAIPKGVMVGVAVAALAAAAVIAWRNSTTTDPNDFVLNKMERYFTCSAGHEFTVTSAEARQISSDNAGIMICPQCKAPASEMFKCPSCGKFQDFVGHGQAPSSCKFCKTKF